MRLFAIVAMLALCGCSTAKVIPLPSGKQGYVIENCRLAACYKRAAKLCGGKYEILGQDSQTTGFVSGGVGYVAPRNSLMVSCP